MENNDNNGILGAPPGFKFAPKDDEIIRYYLINKIHGHQYPWLSTIREFDLYGEKGPWDLLKSDESPVYVFAMSKNLSKERKQRTCSFGTWKYQKNEEIEQGGQCIGYKALLTFMPDAAKIDAHQFGGSWHMSEFSLPDSRDKECFVVCRVSFKYDDIQSNKKRSHQEIIKNRTSKKPRITSSNRQRFGQCSGAVDVPYSLSNMKSQQGVEQFSGAVDVSYSSSNINSEQVVEQCSRSVVTQEPSSSWSVMRTVGGNMIQGGEGAELVLTVDNQDFCLDLSEIDLDFDEVISYCDGNLGQSTGVGAAALDPSYNSSDFVEETQVASNLNQNQPKPSKGTTFMDMMIQTTAEWDASSCRFF